LLLVCAAALLALPAGASAKPGYFVKEKSLRLSLKLPASNGYSASIRTDGHRQVALTITKGDFLARYVALGRVTRKGIEADFGPFGRVSLRFRSRARYHPQLIPGVKLPPFLKEFCKGRRSVGERGLFLGNIRFEGERGYTRVRAHRLEGKLVRSYRRVCRNPRRASASKAKPREESIFFAAQAQRFGITRTLLGAEISFSSEGEEAAITIAVGAEQRKAGRVAVSKAFILIDDLDSVQISPRGTQPLSAEVKLRKPFEGTASYLEEGKAPPTWTGDLGLRLPGSGLVPMAGPEFEAELCQATDSKAFRRCIESVLTEPPLLQGLQGSGSHSQPLALARLSSLR